MIFVKYCIWYLWYSTLILLLIKFNYLIKFKYITYLIKYIYSSITNFIASVGIAWLCDIATGSMLKLGHWEES